MKRLEDLRFYGDAYEGESRGDTTEYYQYAIRDGIVYRAVWAYDRTYLDAVDSMDDIAFDLQDIYRLEPLEDDRKKVALLGLNIEVEYDANEISIVDGQEQVVTTGGMLIGWMDGLNGWACIRP